MTMIISKILLIVFGVILPLMVIYFDKKKSKKKRDEMEIALYPQGKNYECILTIRLLQNLEEAITITGYSNIKHDCVDTFIKYCEWVSKKTDGYVITQDEAVIFIPKQAIQMMSLVSKEKY